MNNKISRVRYDSLFLQASTSSLLLIRIGVEELLSSKDVKGTFDAPLPEDCQTILKGISITGTVKHEWNLLKRIFAYKMIQANGHMCNHFNLN